MQVTIRSCLFCLGLTVAVNSTVSCKPAGDGNTNLSNHNPIDCTLGETRCNDTATGIEVCRSNGWVLDQSCAGDTPLCVDSRCVTCLPEEQYCVGQEVWWCNPQGTPGSQVTICNGSVGEYCVNGLCSNLCEIAISKKSYIGCEYWPTTTANHELTDDFANDFALAVDNPNPVPAVVQVTKHGIQVALEDIPAGGMKTIMLPFDMELKGIWPIYESKIVASGAFHLISSVPVTVYQFNPLNYHLIDCVTQDCYSYSNDASLLFPAHTLSQNYMILSRSTWGVAADYGWSYSPGFFAVVATQDNTLVTVDFSAYTRMDSDLTAYSPGDTADFTLAAGDVLQILSAIPEPDCPDPGTKTSDDCNGMGGSCVYCDMGPEYDLTGSVITASKPVAVYGGHSCTFVPYNYWACDHLEEQIFPAEAWGKEYIVTRTEPQSAGVPEPNVVRVLSREDENDVTFYPATVHDAVTLQRGQWLEFETALDFRVVATKPTAVAQYLVGQNYYASTTDSIGDPAFALVVPFEQYRKEYSFLTPATITNNYVNIIARIGEPGQDPSAIVLDGEPVSFVDVTDIGGSVYGVVRVDLSNSASSNHTITADRPFGIMVYGFANYTSYFYPGGLDLSYINPVD